MLIALAVLGCGPSEAPTIVLPDIPTVEVPERDRPWLRTGEDGQLALFRSAPSRARLQQLRVAALFGEGLDGPRFPAACALEQALCVGADAPLEVDSFEDPGPVTASRFSWLGDHLLIAGRGVPFDVLPEGPAGYHGVVAHDVPLIERLPVLFEGGEWGEGRFEVPLPALLRGVSPDPASDVAVDETGLVPFRWEPDGGELFLTLEGRGWQSVRPIEDDGAVWVDTRQMRLGDAIGVTLTRVVEHGASDLAGNTVGVRTVAEQRWCLTDGCPDDPYPIYPTEMGFEFCWTGSTNCGDSQWRLESDGTWTSGSFGGTWSWDCCNDRIELVFSSGTTYWAERDLNGCFHGEMLSWNGSRGTWTSCP